MWSANDLLVIVGEEVRLVYVTNLMRVPLDLALLR